MGSRRRYSPEEIAALPVDIARRPGRPQGPNHLASRDAARDFLIRSGIFADSTSKSVDELLHAAAVVAQRLSLPFDTLRTTRRAARLAKSLSRALATLNALPADFRRNEMQRGILGHVESGLQSGLFHLGTDLPQLIPERERGLDPDKIAILEREVTAAFNARKHSSDDDARRWWAAQMKLGRERLVGEHQAETRAFLRSLNRLGIRVRFLVLLFYSAPTTVNLRPIELAALALAIGLRGEKRCEDKQETQRRADVWRAARVAAEERHQISPFKRARDALVERMHRDPGAAQEQVARRSKPAKPRRQGRIRPES